MKVCDVAEYFGSIDELAKFLKISRDSVYKWGEFIPAHRQYELEIKTAGKLLSDYSVQKLRENNEKNK